MGECVFTVSTTAHAGSAFTTALIMQCTKADRAASTDPPTQAKVCTGLQGKLVCEERWVDV
eukprot:1152790-Pelagomonas_calceolata.AAC.4